VIRRIERFVILTHAIIRHRHPHPGLPELREGLGGLFELRNSLLILALLIINGAEAILGLREPQCLVDYLPRLQIALRLAVELQRFRIILGEEIQIAYDPLPPFTTR
jgi:hypothetical protein